VPSIIDDCIRVWTLPECDPDLKKYFIISPFTDSDRATWRGYDRVYSHYLKHLRHEPINIMEVGLQSGYGALAWARYFDQANVYGMEYETSWLPTYEEIYDHYPEVKERLHLRCPCNSLLAESWSEFDNNFFDVIIDDGDHRHPSMITTLDNAIDKLKSGGWYFIEDIHLYFTEQVEDYLEYLKPLVTKYVASVYSHTNYSAQAKYSGRKLNIDPEMTNYIIAFQKP